MSNFLVTFCFVVCGSDQRDVMFLSQIGLTLSGSDSYVHETNYVAMLYLIWFSLKKNHRDVYFLNYRNLFNNKNNNNQH
jgi:hypothetical protein